MMPRHRSPIAPDAGMFGEPKYTRIVSTEMRSDGGPGFLLCSDRPFCEVAADLFTDAMRCNKPVVSLSPIAIP